MGCCSCFGTRKRRREMQSQPCRDEDHLRKLETGSGRHTKAAVELPSRHDTSDCHSNARIFTYRELAKVTNNFRRESLIGQGGFGAVYRGKLERTNQIVAVKQLDKTGPQGDKEFLVEVLMLSLLRHPNLVSMIGYCAEGEQRLLVYEYMPLGSLEELLYDVAPEKEILDWNTRMAIASGAAKGLEYLHTKADPPVIYRDLKTSNILLNEEFNPKLSDFGLAKFGPTGDKSHVSTRVMGTHGYCAPEYAESGKLTLKSDIYSFGVVMLELITGRRPVEDRYTGQKRVLVEWARELFKNQKNISELADPLLEGQYPESILGKALEVAFMCLRREANARPNMSEVVLALDYIVSRNYKQHAAKKASPVKVELESSPKETTAMLSNDLDRERALAEAKLWGETWREISKEKELLSSNSWVDRVQTGD